MSLKPKLKKKVGKKQKTEAARVKDSEELALEELVFGFNNEKSVKEILENEEVAIEPNGLGFFIDERGADEIATESEQPKSVWEDDGNELVVDIHSTNRLRKLKTAFDEEKISGDDFEQRLRSQYEKLHPKPSWAVVPDQPELDNEDSNFLGEYLVSKTAVVLNPDQLKVCRVADANCSDYSSVFKILTQVSIQKVKFHPSVPVMITVGLDKTLRIFHLDGKDNAKIQSYFFKDLPIFSCNFTPAGSEIILTGRRNYFYSIDLDKGIANKIHKVIGRDEKSFEKSYLSLCGKYIAIIGVNGVVMLLSAKTKMWVDNLKMNSTAVSVAFTNGEIWVATMDGVIYQWDLDTKKCLHKFKDEGCVKATTITISTDEKWIAIGSRVGVVNVYSMNAVLASSDPKPEKTLMNLTTSITDLTFHPSSQILAFSSSELRDSLRLYHIESKRVFKNWPTGKTPLGYVTSTAFSPNGKYLAIGNDKGIVLLYRLEDFN